MELLRHSERAVVHPKMEVTAALFLLLVTMVTADSPFCEPMEATEKRSPWIRAQQNLGPGCWSSFSNQSRDVHVLHLSGRDEVFALNISAARTADVIIGCTPGTTLYISSNTDVTVHCLRTCHVFGQAAISFEAEDVLAWAKIKFGGVTSFTTLTNPQRITFTGRTAPGGGDVECSPKPSFYPEEYILEHDSPSMWFCSPNSNPTEKEVHVINIADGVEIQNVSIQVATAKKTTLFLKGPQGARWTIEDSPYHSDGLGLSSNNQILLHGLTIPPTLHFHDAESFWADVQLKAGAITSYTEIRRGGPSFRLFIGASDRPASEPQTTAAGRAASPSPSSLQPPPLILQLFDTLDSRTPLGPSARIQPGRRIYANISSQSGPILTFGVTSCQALTHSSCQMTQALHIMTERCYPFSCLISLSLPPIQHQPQDQLGPAVHSTHWVLECIAQYCLDISGQTVCADDGKVHANVEIMQPSSPSVEPCLEFDLSAVLGIAFGGFLIGILLTGALWFIQVRTGRSHSVNKHLPVPTNPASCGDSSASPSIGSTKSSPTSSMA
ncbi:hypothetical protein GJAV_G00029340 [Gymnothorax javanicus]|nr:hypothetical protein GJAV_G00029340 [Gymnothorax javanicus]